LGRAVSIGIPKDSVLKYDVALKTDKYVLVVHGTLSRWRGPKTLLPVRNIAITRFMARLCSSNTRPDCAATGVGKRRFCEACSCAARYLQPAVNGSTEE